MTALPFWATGVLRGAITEIDVAFGSLRLPGLKRLFHASAPGGHVVDLDLGPKADAATAGAFLERLVAPFERMRKPPVGIGMTAFEQKLVEAIAFGRKIDVGQQATVKPARLGGGQLDAHRPARESPPGKSGGLRPVVHLARPAARHLGRIDAPQSDSGRVVWAVGRVYVERVTVHDVDHREYTIVVAGAVVSLATAKPVVHNRRQHQNDDQRRGHGMTPVDRRDDDARRKAA